MALAGSVARRYAEALFELAEVEGAVPDYQASLDRLREAFTPETLRRFRDPSVPIDRRMAAAKAIGGSEPKSIGSLLQLLVQRGNIALLPGIAAAFGTLVDRQQGIAIARITTPIALDESQRDGFVKRLEQASGTMIRAQFSVDPELLGGARVQVGDHLIDGSVRAQLRSLRAQLAS